MVFSIQSMYIYVYFRKSKLYTTLRRHELIKNKKDRFVEHGSRKSLGCARAPYLRLFLFSQSPLCIAFSIFSPSICLCCMCVYMLRVIALKDLLLFRPEKRTKAYSRSLAILISKMSSFESQKCSAQKANRRPTSKILLPPRTYTLYYFDVLCIQNLNKMS